MLEFDDIKIEAYLSGSWVEITDDVLHDPHPKWSEGIQGNGPLDRVGSPGFFTFSLNNSASNSGGLLGYYSPGHTNCRSGWRAGVGVKLTFTFESVDFLIWYGWVMPDGISVTPGAYGERRVDVTCQDWMGLASSMEIDLPQVQTNKRADELLDIILQYHATVQPYATSFSTGEYTFPTGLDTTRGQTSIISEFNKIALSEYGYIFTSRGTLTFQSRDARYALSNLYVGKSKSESGFLKTEDPPIATNYLLQETGGRIVLNETQSATFSSPMNGANIKYGKHMYNRVMNIFYPRRVDAAATTVLYALQEPMELKAGETKTGIRGRYRDPSGGASYVNGKEMVTPASGTDYIANATKGGGGADKTAQLTVTANYGTDSVEYTLTNSDPAAIWVNTLQARGKGIYFYDTARQVLEDTTYQSTYNGRFTLNIDQKYQNQADEAGAFATITLATWKAPDSDVEAFPLWANRDGMNMYGFLLLAPGTRAEFIEAQTNISGNWFINGYTAELNGKSVFWSPILIDSDKSAISTADWLAASAYTYSSQPDGTNGNDTLLPDSDADTNYGSQIYFTVGKDAFNYLYRSLIKFDLTSIPVTATILDAYLYLYLQDYPSNDCVLSIYRVKRAWVEGQATWNIYSAGNNWGTAGCANTTTDREAASIGSITISSGAGRYTEYGISLTAAEVQDWIDGTMTNNGVLLKTAESENGKPVFYSSDFTTSQYRPKLVIRYTL